MEAQVTLSLNLRQAGEFIWLIAAVGFIQGYVMNGLATNDWGWKSILQGGIGALTMVASYGMGGGFSHGLINQISGLATASSIFAGNMINPLLPSMSVPIGDNASLNFGIGFGGSGFNINIGGSYNIDDFTASAGFGAGSNYVGWSGSAAYDGYGLSYGQTYYGDAIGPDGNSNRQITGTASVFGRDWSFRIENDLLGDGKDRWRSNAVEVSIGNFVFGTNLYNNDPGGEIPYQGYDPNGLDRLGNTNKRNLGAWTNGQTYSSPFWIGFRNGNNIARIGYSHPIVQDRTQNWVHRNGFFYLPFGHQRFYNKYDAMYEGTYSYSGYHNPYSLYK
ncbi:MAG: hypothetical protein LBR81_08695 [Prevotellaceae bacterium]|nr:hypothetical protein [Prevotellaceae bacterium]